MLVPNWPEDGLFFSFFKVNKGKINLTITAAAKKKVYFSY